MKDKSSPTSRVVNRQSIIVITYNIYIYIYIYMQKKIIYLQKKIEYKLS